MSTPSRTPRKIMIVSPWPDFWSMDGKAGVSDDAEFVSRALEAGHELHFVVPAGGRFHAEEAHERLHVHTFTDVFESTRWLPTPLRRILWFSYFIGPVPRRALQVARSVQPDIVFGFSYHGARGAELVGRKLNIPSLVKHFGVYTAAFFKEWSPLKYRYKNLETLYGLTRDVDRLVLLNDGSLGREVATRAGFPPERISLLLNGINTEWLDIQYDTAAQRNALGIGQDEAVVLFLARLAHFKGTKQLIRILPELLAAMQRPTRIVIAGSGEDEAWMREAVAQMKCADRVLFLGAVPHDDVPPLFAAADCFLTINTYSNMAIPTCESMVCGTPVVATDVTGTAETVRDGENGRLVPMGDDSALIAAIRAVVEDPVEQARLAEGARRFARENFDSWDRRVGRELDIIDELCERGRSI
ncbi:MAG: glycosyltransferase family 4 protein [bacterium]|nr:glycosyltransferase family 4 protein [bacterium]